jgi:hypothetical protein
MKFGYPLGGTKQDAVGPPLPYSKEAEAALLGAILLDTAKATEFLDSLEPTDFFLPFHQVVFRQMKRLRSLGMPTNDLVLLYDAVAESNETEAAGGVAFITSLTDGRARVSNTAYYAKIIKTNAQARSAIHLWQSNIDRVLGANGNLGAVLKDLSIQSAPTYIEYGQKESDLFKTPADLAGASPVIEFLVEPYIVAGAVTELIAKIKAGKTTYALGELVRKALAKGPVVYLTEQPPSSFWAALNRAGLADARNLFVLFFNAVVGMAWPIIAGLASDKCKLTGAVLLVVDTISHFAGLEGDDENNSGTALSCMKPLLQTAASGIAVLTIRHERKSGGDISDAGRGSSAFGGAADTLLSLRRPEGRTRPTLRTIECVSRFDGLPVEAVYEYSEGHYEYRGIGNEITEREAENAILGAVGDSEETAMELVALLEGTQVARTTAQRVIKRLLAEGKLKQIGKGKKNDPFRYFLAKKLSAQTSPIDGQKEGFAQGTK